MRMEYAIDEKCIEGEIEENPDDPCGYLQCADGSLKEVNCTSGTYFNSSLNICLIDENGICTTKCTEGEIEENPDDPCGYLQCVDGSLKEVNCTSGTYFNSSLNICLIDENGICSTKCTEGEIEENPDDPCGYLQCADGSLKEVNCTSGTYFNSSLNICLIDENGICSTKCTEGEIEENPDDPCGYLQCVDGSLEEVNCTSGTYFNSSLNICLIDENGICSLKCTEGEIEENPDDPCGYLQCVDGSLEEVNCTSGTYFNSSLNICLIDENGICSLKCTEGEIEENPDDPCGYLQCVDGSLEEVNCTSGTYFNSSLNICLIDENGICSLKCTDGEIEENPDDPCGYLQCADGSLEEVNCTSGTYFNSSLNICLIDENGICSLKCTEGEIEENPDDPCGYLQCVDGSLEEVNCTSGTYFNSSLNICLIDENGICSTKCTEGEIEENPDDPCGYLQCVDGSLEEVNCTSGTYFNSSLNICLIDENGICSTKCTEGEIEENPDDPCGYLQCADGSLEEVNCTSGTYFNSSLNICLIDENGICSLKCTEGEIEENPDDPCGYLQCVDGSLKEVNCTSGTYFNSSLKICLIDENGICSLKCTEGEIEENPDDLCGYLICINGNLEELNCTSGSYFNSSIKVCLIDENGICSAIPEECRDGDTEENPDDLCGYLICKDGSFSEANCTSGSYFDSSWKTCIIDENGICSSRNLVEACIEDEIESDPEECAGYLQCIDGERVSQLCAYGSYFDAALKSCEIDYDNVCISKSEICEEGERKEDLDDTTWYFECINGDFVEQKCPEGSYFESSIKGCIIDENGVYIS
ncbi:kielin/chordin-like protein [Drosophila sulfurigaster albostrigata]|uniref:kielin/chordin-like protein n=1 Tax=Drosophila sulfurigaster albostrigata TaxID=89887 RepID=UPI002D219960|nr:kielin/chordin-like protein [Drosophila sulfurigaster albostrigata]